MSGTTPFPILQAAAAKHGITLERIDGADGNTVFIISRWAMSRTVASLDQARQLITRMTGSKP